MFENVIGQSAVIRQIQDDLVRDRLPSSLLFYGEKYTGKQTAALELARVLLCEKGDASWGCGCRSCTMNRRLNHPGLVLTGTQNFIDEIEACGNVFLRQERKAGAFLFIRSIEKLIRRFDPHAFEASEAKSKKIKDAAAYFEDAIRQIDPHLPRPEQKSLEKLVSGCIAKAKLLAEEFPKDNIPVQAVRNITSWVHTTGMSDRKVIVIENCEKMAEGSRNALLKILEEPPNGVYFICISTRKGLIIPTILSRLRAYHFISRDREDEKEVLTSIFGEKNGEFSCLESYFLAWRNINIEEVRASAAKFLQLVRADSTESRDEIEGIIKKMDSKDYAGFFLKNLTELIGKEMRERGNGNPEAVCRYEKWGQAVRHCITGINSYNQKPGLKIEDLLYTMRYTQ